MLTADHQGPDSHGACAACMAAPTEGLPRAARRRSVPVMDLVLLALSLGVCAALTAGFVG